MSTVVDGIKNEDLRAAAEALCKIRSLEATPANIADAAAQISAWRQIQFAIDSTGSFAVG